MSEQEMNKPQRFAMGFSLALVGTLGVIFIFRNLLAFYNPLMLAFCLLVCCGYTVYAFQYDYSRLRIFLAQYFKGLLIVALGAIVPKELYGLACEMLKLEYTVLVNLVPLVCTMGAVIYTTVVDAVPDAVIREK